MLYDIPMFRETTEYPLLDDISETCPTCEGMGIECEGTLEGWQRVCLTCKGIGYVHCELDPVTFVLNTFEVEESLQYVSTSDYPTSLEYAE